MDLDDISISILAGSDLDSSQLGMTQFDVELTLLYAALSLWIGGLWFLIFQCVGRFILDVWAK